ncbi:kinase-like domain-containing protein [Lipomyces oligophaga]|uniref:kinase-like domain-containing protein n=1 Tax=Lipomyces oligophaga TaxID=45792 RepID=UPI0034CF2DFF
MTSSSSASIASSASSESSSTATTVIDSKAEDDIAPSSVSIPTSVSTPTPVSATTSQKCADHAALSSSAPPSPAPSTLLSRSRSASMFIKRAASSLSINSHSSISSRSSSSSSSSSYGPSAPSKPIPLPPGFSPPTVPLSSKYSSFALSGPLRRNTIGKGSTAVVKTVHDIHDHGKVYAVKEFHRGGGAYDSEVDFHAKLAVEYQIVKKLHHTNIVHTVDLCLGSHARWCQVMEYCAGGDLYSLIKASPEPMAARERNCLFKQLIRGVAYLHGKGICHRDIKPENLLLALDGTLKISDFGVSHVVQAFPPDGPVSLCTSICGSIPYMSPEVFSSGKSKDGSAITDGTEPRQALYDGRMLDVWSCAITYFCMAFSGHPFSKADDSDERYVAFRDKMSSFHVKHPDVNFSNPDCVTLPGLRILTPFSNSCRRLLLRMLETDPNRRCTSSQALADPFVVSVEICCSTSESDLTSSTQNLVFDASDKNSHKVLSKAPVRRVHAHFAKRKPSQIY